MKKLDIFFVNIERQVKKINKNLDFFFVTPTRFFIFFG